MLKLMKYQGKEIIYLDASNSTINDNKIIQEHMQKAKKLIEKNNSKAALMITNVTNVKFNKDMVNLFKDYANHNTEYVKASALIGINGL